MICYDSDENINNLFCNCCLLDIYECSIYNKHLKLIDIISHLHHKNIYKIDIKNIK